MKVHGDRWGGVFYFHDSIQIVLPNIFVAICKPSAISSVQEQPIKSKKP